MHCALRLGLHAELNLEGKILAFFRKSKQKSGLQGIHARILSSDLLI